MTTKKDRFCTFSIFGKARRIKISTEKINDTVSKYLVPGTSLQEYSVHKDEGFWEDICKDLDVPNTCTNRKKICKSLQFCPQKSTDDQGQPDVTGASQENTGGVQDTTKDENVKEEYDNLDSCEDIFSATSGSTDSSTKEGLFTCSVPQAPCFFFIEQNDWKDLREKQKGRRFQGLQWTNVFAKGIKSVHPYCSFGFKRHTVKSIKSKKKGPYFTCEGYCRFENCPVKVEVNVTDDISLKAEVSFTGGNVCHNKNELQRRPVRADLRQKTGEILENKLPRSLHLESLVKIDEEVLKSGCRDDAPTKEVLKNISWSQRKQSRAHSDELQSLQKMIEAQKGTDNDVIQRVMMYPKGLMLWSRKTLAIFYKRCKEDITYLDATGSIIQKSSTDTRPYYVYELVVRNPTKGGSPLPVATYVTCDHTIASVTFFLQSFQTDLNKMFGNRANKRPVMIICDGSLVLLNSISSTFCRMSLEDLLQRYYLLISGQHHSQKFDLPILHRCLSHVMKNAKDLCKKHIPKHYKLAMHVFGLIACSSTLEEITDVLQSATVVFCSPCSGKNVTKHSRNLQQLMQKRGTLDLKEEKVIAEDYMMDVEKSPITEHLDAVIRNAPLDLSGSNNIYHAPTFISSLARYFLPHVTLWSGVMLGNLERHGTGATYNHLGKVHSTMSESKKQNYTMDNRTQGVMEKSQWDLKKIRFQRRHLTRLDDFVAVYQKMHTALLLEYDDKERTRKKSYRVAEEKWKRRRNTKKGLYVTPMTTAQGLFKEEETLSHLWKKNDTEVVVSVVPSQFKGNNFVIHHSELRTLRPHQWLTGEIIESLLHITVNRMKLDCSIFLMNHYVTGVILFGKREVVRRNSLSKTNFDNYKAIISFVNIDNVHWKFLHINAADGLVYLLDPSQSSTEQLDSDRAAQRFREFFKMRRASMNLTDWVDLKLKGGVLSHPVQQDGSSCGVIVIKMARAVMEAFPKKPTMAFSTSKTEIAKERRSFAQEILQSSVFDMDNNCAMCSASKTPMQGPSVTDWIQCDTCSRWYHLLCLQMDPAEITTLKKKAWNCPLC